MYLSHKGTFVAAATIFGLGLFLTFVITNNLGQTVQTGSNAQTPTTPSGGAAVLLTPGVSSTASNTLTCAMCDLNGDGVIDAVDIGLIQRVLATNPANPKAQIYLAFCSQFANPSTPVASCPNVTSMPIPTYMPVTPAATTPGATTPAVTGSTTPAPTGSGGASGLGDCNGTGGAGVKDGITNLLDFELLRQELSAEVQSKFCDFDTNGSVDIVDFTDYFRKGYNN